MTLDMRSRMRKGLFIITAVLYACGTDGGNTSGDPPAGQTDSTPPAIVSTVPVPNATGVAENTLVQVVFSEPIDPASMNALSVNVASTGYGVQGTFSVSGAVVTFTPSGSLAANTTFTVTIASSVRDSAGNHLPADYTWSFTTTTETDTTPPVLVLISPAENAVNVPVSSLILVTFSEPVDSASVTASSFIVTASGVVVTGALSVAGAAATFTPAIDLPYGAVITLQLTSAIHDTAGNPLSAATYSFIIEAAPVALSISSTLPLNSAVNVEPDAAVSVTFNVPIDAASASIATFLLEQAGSSVCTSIQVAGSTITCIHPVLAYSTIYTARTTTGLRSTGGGALPAEQAWSFTTRAAPPIPMLALDYTVPADGATGISPLATLTANFSDTLSASTVTVSTFRLTDDTGSAITGSFSVVNDSAVFTPARPLGILAPYIARLTTGISGQVYGALPADQLWSFTTRDGIWGAAGLIEQNDLGEVQVEDTNPLTLGPRIAVDPYGNAVSVWSQATGTRISIWSARYLRGTGWGAARLIEHDETGDAGFANVGMDDKGNAIAVWQQSDGVRNNIWSASYTAAGDAWSAPLLLETDSFDADSPDLAVGVDGSAVAVWRQADGSRYNLMASRRSAAGVWTAPEAAESSLNAVFSPRVGLDGSGSAIAVWYELTQVSPDNRWRVFAARNQGGSWSAAAAIDGSTNENSSEPRIAINASGDAIVVWSQNPIIQNAVTSIWANVYKHTTGLWSGPALLETDDSGFAGSPEPAMDPAGNAIAVWYQKTGTWNDVFARRYDAALGQWQIAVNIDGSGNKSAEYPTIGLDCRGNAVAVWHELGPDTWDIKSARFTKSSGQWSPPVLIENSSVGQARRPRVSLGADGTAACVWNDANAAYFRNAAASLFE